MNSTQIKCFLSLGKTLNFTQTAQELYLAQPTVSKNIHNLEKEIGVTLIWHNHRQIQLTKEGQYFYQILLKLTTEMENAIKKMQDSKITTLHTISIGYSGLPFEKQFLPIFIQLMQQRSKWNIELKEISLSQPGILDKIAKHEIDFMIYQSDFFAQNSLPYSPMIEAGFSVIIRRDSPLKKYAQVPISALNKKIFLWDGKTPLSSVAKLKRALKEKISDNALEIQIIHKVSLATMLVQAKDGIAIVPSFAYDYNNQDVFYRYLDWDYTTKYGLGYVKEKESAPYFKDVIINMRKAINMIKEKWNN